MTKRQPNEAHHHCHISMRVTALQTGEQRQLSENEMAERLEQVLAIAPHERVKLTRVDPDQGKSEA